MKYQCPEHSGTFFTPIDHECHSHEAPLQQRFHNLHCQALQCPRALKGDERYPDVPLISPRNLIERILKNLG